MYRAHCVKCKSPFTVPLGEVISAVCPMCELMNTPLKPPAKRTPSGLPDDVKLLAREIYTRAIISELHRCHAGTDLLKQISHASIHAAKAYFEVENNV